ncbi:MAG: DUF5050 domain-containing protein [Ruminococcaceae bacterium]|nr:DUF5050 domain-containing protein [Oscillospiraceae bacterium]
MENNTKKELKVVLSPDLYDELRFTFRPEVLENVIYKPEILGENKWQCCCGAENELDVCPICGLEKNTIFSKVNAAYLARHRKARIARKKKAVQDQQAMMAAQILKKNKKTKKNDDRSKKFGTLVGIIILCIAFIVSMVMIFGGNDDTGKPSETNIQTTAPDLIDNTTSPEEESTSPVPETTVDETEPETTEPETTAPIEPVEVPMTPTKEHVATIGEGKWPTGASGNVTAGGLVYTDETYDYVGQNGIIVLDKNGNKVDTLTENKTLGITGSGNYIFYIDEAYSVHRIDKETKEDIAFPYKAKMICAYFDELYYVPNEGAGFYASNLSGDTTKIITATLTIYALNATADKLYFSTEESLAVITSKEGAVTTFCPGGAKANSIIEIADCVFFTSPDGILKFYNPALANTYGVEYPVNDVAITLISAYENRIYVRTYNSVTGQTLWYFTRWTPGTWMFNPAAFATTGIYTDSLYISRNAVYEGNFYRYQIS